MLPQTIVGWDLSKNSSHVTAVSKETGEILKQEKISHDPEEIADLLSDLDGSVRIVFEATGNWQAIYECLEDQVEEIQMAHPYKVKAIASARIKTDKIDSAILAHLGRADLIPQAWIPPREVRDLRETLRHRAFLVSLQTRVKNRIHTYLDKLGIQLPKGISDLFGKKGMEFLGAVSLREPYQQLNDQDLKLLKTIRQQIKDAADQIDKLAEKDPRTQWILPIRGLGPYSAMLILSEIGDIHRFPSPQQLISYAGLCPSTYQSGNTLRHGRITKQGSKWLRWVLIETATRYHKAPGKLGDFYRRLEKRKGSKVARVALAREILKSIYWCLKKGVAFQEQPIIRGQRRFSRGLSS